jgi:hypothetical protein
MGYGHSRINMPKQAHLRRKLITNLAIPEWSTIMEKSEPPSKRATPLRLFRIGRNRRGHWVVQDHYGLCGGLFIDRTEALKFAMFENGNRPEAVIMVREILELDMSRKWQGQTVHTALRRAA